MIVNGVNTVRLAAAARLLRRQSAVTPLPARDVAAWLDGIARITEETLNPDDVPGLHFADRVAKIVVGEEPAPDWVSDQQRAALLRLLTSGPIGTASGVRYVRADLIRDVLGGGDAEATSAGGDPEQPGRAVHQLAHAANMHYRYCDLPGDCAACAGALTVARNTLEVLRKAGWHLVRTDAWADRVRAAARAAHALRGPEVAEQPAGDAVPYLLGEAVELADAIAEWVRDGGSVEHVCDEAGDVGIVLDHIVDKVTGGGRTLADVMETKVGRDRSRFPSGGSDQ